MSASNAAGLAPASTQQQSNSSGIPPAPFIEDVAQFLGGEDEQVDGTLKKFQEMMSKYKFMEASTTQRRLALEDKIPDIEQTLEMVQLLKQQRDQPDSMKTTFELNDTLFAHATLEPIETVNLWLGANVMLTYPLDEAIELLSSKLDSARKSLTTAKSDMTFLRDQITIMEVNTARVHNFDVKRRRLRRMADDARPGGPSGGTKASSTTKTAA